MATVLRTIGANIRRSDVWLLLATAALTLSGLLMVYSASVWVALQKDLPNNYYLVRQGIAVGVGGFALLVAAGLPFHWLERIAAPLYAVNVALLLVVLLFGEHSGGAIRWFSIHGLNYQPSETMKLAIILMLAAYFGSDYKRARSLKNGLLVFAVLIILPAALIVKEPDLGTTLILFVSAAAVLFAAGTRLLYIVAAGGASVAAVIGLILHAPYRLQRITAFRDPLSDKLGQTATYQVKQALIALGSGGITGQGFGLGLQKYSFLPAPHTDSIFAIVGEEFGLIGAIAMMCLFAVVAWRGFTIAKYAPDQFSGLVAYGVTAMVICQAIFNIGSVTSAIPFTGVPLPFISYGGSAMVVTLAGVGLLLNVGARLRPDAVPVADSRRTARTQSARKTVVRHRTASPRDRVPGRPTIPAQPAVRSIRSR
ncbi:MAG: putative lipid II flippase FtsW [Chloroflexi bacterium]|nr:putative lipid II flippase FtsW [Chloroflexota bacterium]